MSGSCPPPGWHWGLAAEQNTRSQPPWPWPQGLYRDGGKTPCAGAAPCTASPGSLKRNSTAEPSEVLLPRMGWDLTSPFSQPSFACNVFPFFFFKLNFFSFHLCLFPALRACVFLAYLNCQALDLQLLFLCQQRRPLVQRCQMLHLHVLTHAPLKLLSA